MWVKWYTIIINLICWIFTSFSATIRFPWRRKKMGHGRKEFLIRKLNYILRKKNHIFSLFYIAFSFCIHQNSWYGDMIWRHYPYDNVNFSCFPFPLHSFSHFRRYVEASVRFYLYVNRFDAIFMPNKLKRAQQLFCSKRSIYYVQWQLNWIELIWFSNQEIYFTMELVKWTHCINYYNS